MSARDEAVDIASQAVADITQKLGINLDAGTALTLAGLVVGVVSGTAWSAAEQAGREAAARIVTVEDAEAAAKART